MRQRFFSWDHLRALFGSSPAKKRLPPRSCQNKALALEPLEQRHLLSVSPIGSESLVNTFTGNTQRLYESGNALAASLRGAAWSHLEQFQSRRQAAPASTPSDSWPTVIPWEPSSGVIRVRGRSAALQRGGVAKRRGGSV